MIGEIDRTQTGVRLNTQMLKVLRAVADLRDMTLGDLLEGIVLHAFDAKSPFGPETLAAIDKLRDVYGLQLTSADSHLHPDPAGSDKS